MNNQRRKRINSIIEQLEILRGELVEINEEEQEALDNIPENMTEGERAERMNEASDNMNNADDSFETLLGELQEIAQ